MNGPTFRSWPILFLTTFVTAGAKIQVQGCISDLGRRRVRPWKNGHARQNRHISEPWNIPHDPSATGVNRAGCDDPMRSQAGNPPRIALRAAACQPVLTFFPMNGVRRFPPGTPAMPGAPALSVRREILLKPFMRSGGSMSDPNPNGEAIPAALGPVLQAP